MNKICNECGQELTETVTECHICGNRTNFTASGNTQNQPDVISYQQRYQQNDPSQQQPQYIQQNMQPQQLYTSQTTPNYNQQYQQQPPQLAFQQYQQPRPSKPHKSKMVPIIIISSCVFVLISVFIIFSMINSGRNTGIHDLTPPMPIPEVTDTPPVPTPIPEEPVIEDITTPPVPTPSISFPLTFDDAMSICNAWLNDHPELTSFAIEIWDYEPDYPPHPTYSLFGEQYYEFFVSYIMEENFGYSHVILVNEKNGELLMLYHVMYDGEYHYMLEHLDVWYQSEQEWYDEIPALLTSDDAFIVYNTWLNDRLGIHADTTYFRINNQPFGTYVLFGEQYYFFESEDSSWYWYNILVHMETGELLIMIIYDGQFGGTDIELLDTWDEWDEWFSFFFE